MHNIRPQNLILASKSPARREILSRAGLAFTCEPARIDERSVAGSDLSPADQARRLADGKAHAVCAHHPEALVIGSDQILALEGHVLHTPRTSAAARERLENLSGRTHQLLTAVSLVWRGETVWSHLETANLTMRSATGPEIDSVLAAEGDTLLQSVGAYRLEGPSIRLFEKIEGDYFTILGLPLLPLLSALRHNAPHLLDF